MEYIRIPKVDKVKLVDNVSLREISSGTLYLTATHLIYVDSSRNTETWIVHTHIQSVEKVSITSSGSPILLRCKTFQVLTYTIANERECHDLYSSLLKLSRPVRISDLYAFSYNPRDGQKQKDGWDMFNLDVEFMRMGLPTHYWEVSHINKDFGLCDTYPQLICVPTASSPALLHGSALFRSKGRLPVMSYLHTNGAVMCRCSQPLSGLNSRSMDDESYVDLIRRSTPNNKDFIYIVDTRPRVNAVVNRAQGKGYENPDYYENIKYQFLGIENIHVMRASLSKLLEVCGNTKQSMSSWLENLNSSGWLKHIYSVIQVSRFIAHAIGVEARSVIVHCSDGWDRTAQTCSLASVMLNAHYRTIEGFLALIQKEWLSFGHKFAHRCGHLDGDIRETSPIFTQFIDAVWQLMRYRPAAFQFNEQFLLDIHDHVYSCQFGTFLANCEKERSQYDLSTKTHSLWAWLWKRTDMYINPLYSATERHNNIKGDLILPSTCPQAVRFWKGMYNRYDKGLHPRESIQTALSSINSESALLRDSYSLLKVRLDELESEKQELDKSQLLNNSAKPKPKTLLEAKNEIETVIADITISPSKVADVNHVNVQPQSIEDQSD